jgi:hypothetical protein
MLYKAKWLHAQEGDAAALAGFLIGRLVTR